MTTKNGLTNYLAVHGTAEIRLAYVVRTPSKTICTTDPEAAKAAAAGTGISVGPNKPGDASITEHFVARILCTDGKDLAFFLSDQVLVVDDPAQIKANARERVLATLSEAERAALGITDK